MSVFVRLFRLLGIRSDDALRAIVLGLVCVGIGLLTVDYGGSASERLEVGDVAPRTVKAPRSFTFADEAERARRQDDAREAVLPVYEHRAGLATEHAEAVRDAFAASRSVLLDALASAEIPVEEVGQVRLPAEVREPVRSTFHDHVKRAVQDSDIDAFADTGFSQDALDRVLLLLREADSGLIVTDREVLPEDRGPMTVVRQGADASSASERLLRDYEAVRVPAEVRRELEVRSSMLEHVPWTGAALRLAGALVEPNLQPWPEQTEVRREQAAASVEPVDVFVKRGTVLFRDGEELDASQIARYRALQEAAGPALWLEIVSIVFFAALLVFTLVQFGTSNLRRFSISLRDVTAVGVLVLLTTMLARVGVGISEVVSQLIGYDCEPRSVWFVIPVAAAPMLVRLLIGVNWALVTGVIVAAVCGLLMDLDALMVLFAFFSSLVAAGSVHQTRERMAVLRAGLLVGVANAAMALLIHFLGFFMGEGEVLAAVTLRPVWSMAFAFGGGLLASVLVLGLTPVFESMGFVTDYRLMELANLNHPLMRQLMLRAPGSYHHSVVVGSLSEAACEAIGVNALQTRVAAYFHDIGKSLKPQYFVENQGSGGSRHKGLDPYTSAAIIISHVTDGAELARQHRLPKPCLDNIYMHHGTGLLQYFYARAVEEAGGDESAVDESAFRYPGPRPDSKEAGILMLADKVEAATRTIKDPTEDKFRSMIHAIINSVMADNQFEHCPLTFQELYSITDAFVGVLLGIHHQRIEYPQTAHLSAAPRRDVPPPPRQNTQDIITLEIPSEAQLRSGSPVPVREKAARRPAPTQPDPLPREETDETSLGGDYEAVEYLPTGEPVSPEDR